MVTPAFELPDEAATLAFGAALAACLEPGDAVHLHGDLGAGKTTLVRGALRALGHRGPVKSPTYALVELYELSRLDLHHFDFYRFHDPREWSDAGFRESFGGRTVTLVEWPERAGQLLPTPDMAITLESQGDGRIASFTPRSPRGHTLCACLASHASSFSPTR